MPDIQSMFYVIIDIDNDPPDDPFVLLFLYCMMKTMKYKDDIKRNTKDYIYISRMITITGFLRVK